MQKKLFTAVAIKKTFHNATVGSEYYHPRYTYIDGYYEAAKILVDSALKSRQKDILFYPICFNYRHYLELHLKSLTELSEELYCFMVDFDYIEDTLEKSSEKPLREIHSIQTLFEYFQKRLQLVAVNGEIFDPNIRNYIMQFHSIDSDGQKFRYHITKQNKSSFPKKEMFDLKNLVDIMKKIHDLLYGVDGWIEHCIDMSNDMIKESNGYAN